MMTRVKGWQRAQLRLTLQAWSLKFQTRHVQSTPDLSVLTEFVSQCAQEDGAAVNLWTWTRLAGHPKRVDNAQGCARFACRVVV